MVMKDKEERENNIYNQGRWAGDRKWVEAIKKRIKQLEDQNGITELRKLLNKTMYRWSDKEDEYIIEVKKK